MRFKCGPALFVTVLASLVSQPALAQQAYQDRARVVSVTPHIERVNTPRQACRTEYVQETVYERQTRSNTGAIVGGIAGGVVGSRFGGGNGRIVSTALGAGVGAMLGDRYDHHHQPVRGRVVKQPVTHCVVVDNWQSVTTGYWVHYTFQGRQYTTMTDHDPGRYLPVHVSVHPGGSVSTVHYRVVGWSDQRRGRGHDTRPRKNHGRHQW